MSRRINGTGENSLPIGDEWRNESFLKIPLILFIIFEKGITLQC
jgi:hypothetical protein